MIKYLHKQPFTLLRFIMNSNKKKLFMVIVAISYLVFLYVAANFEYFITSFIKLCLKNLTYLNKFKFLDSLSTQNGLNLKTTLMTSTVIDNVTPRS